MPGRGASRPPELRPEPAARTWRLPLRYRITLVAVQALIPLAAASLFWVPVTGSWYLPAPLTWFLLAACSILWQKLVGRTWQESVALTEGMLVVRNVFRTRKVPLADISAVWFRRGALVVVVVAAAAAAAAESGSGRRSGRHAGGLQITVGAVKLGAAYWSGRRTGGDDAAGTIAAAAGLLPLAPRRELISLRTAVIMVPAGIAVLILGGVLGLPGPGADLIPSAGEFLSTCLRGLSFFLVVPASLVMLDRFIGIWRDRSLYD
jgi:hypothetical protein